MEVVLATDDATGGLQPQPSGLADELGAVLAEGEFGSRSALERIAAHSSTPEAALNHDCLPWRIISSSHGCMCLQKRQRRLQRKVVPHGSWTPSAPR